jgi:hypothetical protein
MVEDANPMLTNEFSPVFDPNPMLTNPLFC